MENAERFYEINEKSRLRVSRVLLKEVKDRGFRRLCDIGCGNGHFLRNFPNKKVEGLELSQEMIDQAGELKPYIKQADIANCPKIISERQGRYDMVTSNYVFTELTENQLRNGFSNIHQILSPNGKLIFTITDPRTRDRIVFPEYCLQFDEPYAYEKKDLRFNVLLRTSKGFEDVGIVDYHRPIEDYDKLLRETGFTKIHRRNITFQERNKRVSYAVIYSANKD